MKNTFDEYLRERISKDFIKKEIINEASTSDLTTGLVPNLTDFKSMSRKGIIAVVAMMLDNLNIAYMQQHNGDSLFGKNSIYKKLITK